MKKEMGFFRSLEQYGWKVLGRSPLPKYWKHIAIGLILTVLATSVKYAKYSVASADNTQQAIELAVKNGDYEMAQRLYKNCTVPQCHSVTEEMIYPERVVEKRIAELEQKLEEYPSNREIFTMLGELYGELGRTRANTGIRPYGEIADEYREKARVLDPNGVEFK